jgi:uncharacterized membrane protein YvlD (DUF360 family)
MPANRHLPAVAQSIAINAMFKALVRFVLGAAALPLADYLLSGFWCYSTETAFAAGAALMLMYALIRPILRLLLSVFNFLTLGLVNMFIDTGLLYFITILFPGYIHYESFLWLFLASLIVNSVRALAGLMFGKRR